MANTRVPNEFEIQILKENGVDTNHVGILRSDADCIRVLNYLTRDIIVIWKGDRKW